MADTPNVPFIMQNARETLSRGMTHLEEHVNAIEQAVTEKPGLAFDLAKALIESICRTILKERGVEFKTDDALPELFKTVTRTIAFLPPEASDEIDVRRRLTQTLNGLNATVQGICELRNACGFASHGDAKPRPLLESAQALLAAGAADTVIGFLYRMHCRNRVIPELDPTDYDRNPDFNDYIDDNHEIVQIFDEEFLPSRILFEMAPEPYRIYLTDYLRDFEEE